MESLFEIYRKKLQESVIVNQSLNPILWESDNSLKPEIREKLLQIVEYFKEYVDVPLNILDIRLVGSNASYNYKPDSDIDLHIVVEFEDIGSPKGLVSAFLNGEKSRFNEIYDILIKGIPVEVYVEDINTSAISNGVFSVMLNKWIKNPTRISYNIPEIDISKEVKIFREKIDSIISTNDIEDLKTLLNSIYLMRKDSILNEGEFGKGNLVFKELRSIGDLDKIKDSITKLQSKTMSLESVQR